MQIDPKKTRKQKIMGGGNKNSEVTVISCSYILALHDLHIVKSTIQVFYRMSFSM